MKMNLYLESREEFNSEECWYKEACPKFNTEECHMGCIRHFQMYNLLNQAGIPKPMQYKKNLTLYPDECDLEKYRRLAEIVSDIEDWVKDGNNLFIFSSNCGNGKTTWAIKLMCQYFNKIWYGNGFEIRGLFVDVGEFLSASKRNISEPVENYYDYVDYMKKSDLVVLDDIGVRKLTEFEHDTLMEIINYRVRYKKSTIYTSNLDSELLELQIGRRLHSRVINSSEIIEFKGVDRRGI